LQKEGLMIQIVVPDCLDDPVVETCFRRHLAHIPGARIYPSRPRDEAEVAARLAEADCALLHFEARRVSEAALAQAPRLRVIAIAGAGTGCVDLAAARARGIRVATTLQAAIPAVAEMTVGMMLALARGLATLDARTRLGEWPVMHGFDLDGKTLGLVGLGAIARHVARIATALGMRVMAWSPHLTEARAAEAGVQHRDLPALMAESDVVSIHLRAVPELAGTIDQAALARMKPTAILINTARAALVDEDALYECLRDRRIHAAGLDVFGSEPLGPSHRWRDLPNVLLAPHTAWRTVDTLDRFVARALANALAADGGPG
jgi:phosphoglycerate dehydrogenase-like enzyme